MHSRIVILSGNHACHNPRALKEAETLAAAGYQVEWLGGWYDSDLAARDRQLLAGQSWKFTPVVDLTRGDHTWHLQHVRQRARRWIGLRQFRWFGRENSAQLGYCARELFAAAQS